jgi:hypothetical protein
MDLNIGIGFDVGFVGERRAIAQLPLAFFGLMFLLSALVGDPAWTAASGALASIYLTAFFALAAGWFWGRWVATGIGASGAVSGLLGLFQGGWNPALGLYVALHAAMALPLMGQAMAEQYELTESARARLKMADKDIQKLGKAVSRAAGSLPFLVIFVLAPRPEPGQLLLGGLAIALAGSALFGLLRLRTWGALLPAGAAALLMAAVATSSHAHLLMRPMSSCSCRMSSWSALYGGHTLAAAGIFGTLMLALAALPLLPLVVAHLRGRR